MKFKFRNHVGKHGKAIRQDLKRAFGVDGDMLDKALAGDEESLKYLGEMSRQGKIALELLPMIEESLITGYQAQEQYNRTQANVLRAGSKAALGIKKARVDVALANQKHGNESKEIAVRLKLGKTSETQRHSFAMGYERLKAFVSAHINQTEQVARIEQTLNQPAVKQIGADADYKLQIAKHYLENGEKSQQDLITRRVYQLPEGKDNQPGWFTKLKQLVGIN